MSIATHPDTLSQRVETALNALRRGLPVIVPDDHDREDEADLILAADTLSETEMARLIRDCSGIVCLCLTAEHAARLQLPPMTQRNGSRYGTAFTVSIEAAQGVSTGVSAADRVRTIQAAVHPQAQAGDVVSPGHVFPLVAAEGGVQSRRGHTEAAVELARLAGFQPAGVLCELMNPDGSMMRGPQIADYARRHALPILSVAELAEWISTQNLAASPLSA
ncbi:3,4-dihydroxy-2-butanone-4-phosphate synthase [Chromobacterium haemolyticum]|uniref:3,4-dihydroxy-2-butanone-4-phosphate synthase n=1 Tax=Chromobacterium TaxID=535 RepID=UPI001888668E|nr:MULTISPECIES: 3,4-dihydroxy-2-butanone-4-phosphate synthase [Chromobacterium]MDH0342656.1 3,4-dihydroxy-2-butanone-4-phosphate synthase [Chromobacterium haemolyticum]UGA36055.1 3,4-dihydroxy-2-butanone-4-phosphate synthase [Chromobacterium haemolyticum]WON85973.1 3,4-dihydroxy-2-butanone-4-phosphate synthase [Chromobacterium haemolyticum]